MLAPMRKIVSAALAIGSGVAIGLGSALTYLGSAGLSAVLDNPNWVEADVSTETTALPYALGHYLLEGVMPPPNSLRQFTRSRDEDGNTLRGDCVFVLEGNISTARWWTVAATNSNGTALNAQSVLAAGQALSSADGRFKISFASSPVAGNWIKVPSSAYTLAITLHDATDEEESLKLPTIRRGNC